MRRRVTFGLIVLDALCVFLGIVTAWLFWLWRTPNLQNLVQVHLWELMAPNPWMPSGVVFLIAWLIALNRLGLHDPGRMENSVRIAQESTRAAVYMVVFTLVLNNLLAARVYPKGLVLPLLGSSWLYVTTARLLVFRLLLRLEAPPTAVNALIVGIGADAAAMTERLERDARHVCTVVGHLKTALSGAPHVAPERILGDIGDLAGLVNKLDVRVLILATRTLPRDDSMRLAVQADRMGLRVLQVPYSWGVVSPRLGFARVGGLDLIDLAGIKYPTLGEQVKRVFDLVAVVTGGALILPFLLLVALAIRISDGGPALYVSKRTGRGGRTFDFYKFRSMVVGADKLKADLAAQNETDGRLFKIKRDPRITPIGRFIRTFSIDELPQLLNVLRGEMNLVGPRPLPAEDMAGIEHDDEMRYWFEQRGKVNPGITGMWQVMGRSDLGFAEMVRHDIYYIQNWSLWLDLQILVKTIPAVFKGRGAS